MATDLNRIDLNAMLAIEGHVRDIRSTSGIQSRFGRRK